LINNQARKPEKNLISIQKVDGSLTTPATQAQCLSFDYFWEELKEEDIQSAVI